TTLLSLPEKCLNAKSARGSLAGSRHNHPQRPLQVDRAEAWAGCGAFSRTEENSAVWAPGAGTDALPADEQQQQTNLPIFKLKESCVRRRYSDFEWLKNELERDSKIVVPPLPGKALKRQLPFRGDEGIFEESFIEERRQGLEQFINKIAGHPLAQNERCLHMFLQEETIDRNYVPGKVRQ
uniref:Sorting nexin 12 n=1 Tax=Taeniopygia guttata TaxID=59729 RepID=A0A674HDR7_TAEGU